MRQDGDLRGFNKGWIQRQCEGAFPNDIVAGLPLNLARCSDRLDLVEQMGSCFMRPTVDSEGMAALMRFAINDAAESVPTSIQPGAIGLATTKLIREWFFLARLKALDALAGNYASMCQMHLKWSDVRFYAELTNESINSFAVRAGRMTSPPWQWAWPVKIFEPSTQVPASLNRAWAFALTA